MMNKNIRNAYPTLPELVSARTPVQMKDINDYIATLEFNFEVKRMVNVIIRNESGNGTKLFAKISNEAEIETIDVIKTIVGNDTYNMYDSYTCIDNSKLDSFYVQFAAFIHLMNKNDLKLLSTPKEVFYYGQTYWDLVSFLENIGLHDDTLLNMRKELVEFLKKRLIILNN